MKRRKAQICVIRHGYFPEDPRVRKEVGALLDVGYGVDVLCLRDRGEAARETWRSARIYRLPVRHERRGVARYLWEYSVFFSLALVGAAALHTRRRYQLVQVNTLPDALVFAAAVPKALGARVLLDMHELMPEFAAEKFRFPGSSILVRLVTLVERWAGRFADGVIAVSPPQAAVLERRIGKTCKVVPNVPDTALFENVSGDVAKDDVPTLITHGTLTEAYGVQLLVRALPTILSELPARALIVGDGAYLTELRRQATALGLEDHIEFTGRVPFPDIPSYISRSSVGVITLLRSPQMDVALPNKLFEYVAMGLPVIAPDLAGMRSYFDDNQLVFFRPGDSVDLAEKIVSVLRDRDRRTRVAEGARTVYRELRWERTSQVYVGLVGQLVAQRS